MHFTDSFNLRPFRSLTIPRCYHERLLKIIDRYSYKAIIHPQSPASHNQVYHPSRQGPRPQSQRKNARYTLRPHRRRRQYCIQSALSARCPASPHQQPSGQRPLSTRRPRSAHRRPNRLITRRCHSRRKPKQPHPLPRLTHRAHHLPHRQPHRSFRRRIHSRRALLLRPAPNRRRTRPSLLHPRRRGLHLLRPRRRSR